MGVSKYLGVSKGSVGKISGVDADTLSKVMGVEWGVAIPDGLILPYYSDAAVPSGWGAWTLADGSFVVGAGSTYAVAATGGSLSVGISISADSGHTSSSTHCYVGGGAGCCCYTYSGSYGAHSHTATLTYTPPYRQMRFIKASSAGMQIPALALALGVSDFSGTLTQYLNNDGYIIRPNTSRATGGGSVPGAVSSNSNGNHYHGSQGACSYDDEATTRNRFWLYTGAQAHTITPTIATHAVKRMYLTAWSKAASSFPLEAGLIGMYENTTPPTGWSLCDGSGGTPDLRDYFIEFGTTSNHGTTAGNNTVAFTWTVSNHSNHSHLCGTTKTASSVGRPHGNYPHTNNHGTTNSPSYIPPYYGIAFIMYTG